MKKSHQTTLIILLILIILVATGKIGLNNLFSIADDTSFAFTTSIIIQDNNFLVKSTKQLGNHLIDTSAGSCPSHIEVINSFGPGIELNVGEYKRYDTSSNCHSGGGAGDVTAIMESQDLFLDFSKLKEFSFRYETDTNINCGDSSTSPGSYQVYLTNKKRDILLFNLGSNQPDSTHLYKIEDSNGNLFLTKDNLPPELITNIPRETYELIVYADSVDCGANRDRGVGSDFYIKISDLKYIVSTDGDGDGDQGILIFLAVGALVTLVIIVQMKKLNKRKRR